MIAEAFDLREGGARVPGEWASKAKLLPAHAGVIGGRRVLDAREVKEHESLILRHLARRRSLPGRKQ